MARIIRDETMGEILVGTSGWAYPEFDAVGFYAGVPRRAWLAHYAQRFDAVEINASYYRLQARGTFARWREETPAHFRFAIKANRYLINRRLRDPEEPLARERASAEALGDKLAAVLWQFPHRFAKDLERLARFADALTRWPVPQVVEFRHSSWFTDDVRDCLREHGIASCISDARDWPEWDAVTADPVYVRLHGHTRTYASAYTEASLARWAERARHWRDAGHGVHLYFDNTAGGAAVRNALRLRELVGGGAERGGE